MLLSEGDFSMDEKNNEVLYGSTVAEPFQVITAY